jgi:cytochrome c-type biogenesis protein CcmH
MPVRRYRLMHLLIMAMFSVAVPMAARAVQPDEIMADTKQEQRARAISGGLRCLVCQNQSIDDSDAPLAKDLRLLVRERITAGDSDVAVVDYVVAVYGDFVLLKPPLKPETMLLWLSPLVLLLGGIWLGRRQMREPVGDVDQAVPLSSAEREKLDRILSDKTTRA